MQNMEDNKTELSKDKSSGDHSKNDIAATLAHIMSDESTVTKSTAPMNVSEKAQNEVTDSKARWIPI